jgi:hypothetical protein
LDRAEDLDGGRDGDLAEALEEVLAGVRDGAPAGDWDGDLASTGELPTGGRHMWAFLIPIMWRHRSLLSSHLAFMFSRRRNPCDPIPGITARALEVITRMSNSVRAAG